MAKLLHENDYNELIADRERLEWMGTTDARWSAKYDVLTYYGNGTWLESHATTMREAIDKARGAA